MDISDILMGIIWAGIGLVCAHFRAEYMLWRKTAAAERDLRTRYRELYNNRRSSNAQNRPSLTASRIVKDNLLLTQRDPVDAA